MAPKLASFVGSPISQGLSSPENSVSSVEAEFVVRGVTHLKSPTKPTSTSSSGMKDRFSTYHSPTTNSINDEEDEDDDIKDDDEDSYQAGTGSRMKIPQHRVNANNVCSSPTPSKSSKGGFHKARAQQQEDTTAESSSSSEGDDENDGEVRLINPTYGRRNNRSPDTPSSQELAARTRAVSISEDQTTLYEVESHRNYSTKERARCWYNEKDKAKMLARHERVVARLEQQKPCKPTQTYRGLESWTTAGATALDAVISQSVDAVMDEQDRQWRENSDDMARIASCSLAVTGDSALRARALAIEDEAEAQQIRLHSWQEDDMSVSVNVSVAAASRTGREKKQNRRRLRSTSPTAMKDGSTSDISTEKKKGGKRTSKDKRTASSSSSIGSPTKSTASTTATGTVMSSPTSSSKKTWDIGVSPPSSPSKSMQAGKGPRDSLVVSNMKSVPTRAVTGDTSTSVRKTEPKKIEPVFGKINLVLVEEEEDSELAAAVSAGVRAAADSEMEFSYNEKREECGAVIVSSHDNYKQGVNKNRTVPPDEATDQQMAASSSPLLEILRRQHQELQLQEKPSSSLSVDTFDDHGSRQTRRSRLRHENDPPGRIASKHPSQYAGDTLVSMQKATERRSSLPEMVHIDTRRRGSIGSRNKVKRDIDGSMGGYNEDECSRDSRQHPFPAEVVITGKVKSPKSSKGSSTTRQPNNSNIHKHDHGEERAEPSSVLGIKSRLPGMKALKNASKPIGKIFTSMSSSHSGSNHEKS